MTKFEPYRSLIEDLGLDPDQVECIATSERHDGTGFVDVTTKGGGLELRRKRRYEIENNPNNVGRKRRKPRSRALDLPVD